MCATIPEEVVEGTIEITGALLVYSTPTSVLFDSSSTHAFIAKIFVNRTGMSIEDLDYDLVVLTHA